MEFDNIANEKYNQYTARKLKTGYDMLPGVLHCLTQTLFPTDGTTGLLVGCCIRPAQAAAAGGSGDPQLSPPPTVGPCES